VQIVTLRGIATISGIRRSNVMEQDSFCIIDFETTGLSPGNGDRIIEVAALKIYNNKIVDQYQSLINPEFEISRRITGITGITNEMLEDSPSSSKVMPFLVDFLGNNSLVAHNASFDSNFFNSELAFSNIKKSYQFTCSMRMARRVFPNSPNHKLETLLEYRGIDHSGQFHRALADVNATYHLWIDMNQHTAKKRGKKLLTFLEMKSLL
jgi:DNA polymerase-3 subunit epsilon